MNKTKAITHIVTIGTLVYAVVFIDIAGNIPRVLPAFHQRFFPVLLSLLGLVLPVSAWKCRE